MKRRSAVFASLAVGLVFMHLRNCASASAEARDCGLTIEGHNCHFSTERMARSYIGTFLDADQRRGPAGY